MSTAIVEAPTKREARELAREQYIQQHPEPLAPEKPTQRRAQIVALSSSHRMWVEVSLSYREPEISICQARDQQSANVAKLELGELMALQEELQRAREDFEALSAFKVAYKDWEQQHDRWEENRSDAVAAGALLWENAHPDAEKDRSRYDEDEDD